MGPLITLVLLISAPLLLPNGGWWLLVTLALLGVHTLSRGKVGALKPLWQWLAMLPLLIALTTLLAVSFQEGGTWLGEWPRLLTLLLCGLAALAIPRLRLSTAALFGAFAFTGIAVGGWALWQRIVGSASRVNGHEPLHAILFGNLALTTGLLCLAGLAWAWRRPQPRRWLLLCGVGALGGLAGSILSGTRGGWLALPLASLIFYRAYLVNWPRLWRVGLVMLATLLLVGVYALPQTGVRERVAQAVNDVQSYQPGKAHSSVGIRLELYRTGLGLIREKPLSGYSLEGYQNAMQSLHDQGAVHRLVAKNWHVHNDILHAGLRYGVIGALATLALYIWPLWYFTRCLHKGSLEQRPVAVAGLLLPVMFFDFGLSYSFFAYPTVLATYWSWLILVLAGMPRRLQ